MTPDCFIHHFPGRYVSLRLESADQDLGQATNVALAALDALSGVVRPLAADLEVTCGPEDSEAPSHSHIRATDLDSRLCILPFYEHTTICESVNLDHASIAHWIQSALNLCESETAQWTELRINASCACLGIIRDNPQFVVLSDSGPAEVPTRFEDSATWVCGPVRAAPTEPPIDLSFWQEFGVISLKIHIHWSCWTEVGSGGWAKLQLALASLQRLGWVTISTDLVYSL